jgi:hypothetical protein
LRADLIRTAVLALLATIGLAILLPLLHDSASWLLRTWLLLLGVIVLAGFVPLILGREAEDDGPAWRLPPPWSGARRSVRRLEELEHLTEFATATAFDFHHRLRPHLVRIAAHRLARHGVRMPGEPERARALLGDAAFELVRADVKAPEQRHAPGLPVERIGDLVERLRAL